MRIRVKYVDKKLFNRRVRNDSIMTSCKTKNNISCTSICAPNELYDLYIAKEKNLDNPSTVKLYKMYRGILYERPQGIVYISNEGIDCVKRYKNKYKKK